MSHWFETLLMAATIFICLEFLRNKLLIFRKCILERQLIETRVAKRVKLLPYKIFILVGRLVHRHFLAGRGSAAGPTRTGMSGLLIRAILMTSTDNGRRFGCRVVSIRRADGWTAVLGLLQQ